MNDSELLDRVANMASDLGEHFDAVQILCSYTDDMGTHTIRRGSGNWFARQGMAHEFIRIAEADIDARALGDELKMESD